MRRIGLSRSERSCRLLAGAYSLLGYTWTQPSVPYYINPTNLDVPASAIEPAVQAAQRLGGAVRGLVRVFICRTDHADHQHQRRRQRRHVPQRGERLRAGDGLFVVLGWPHHRRRHRVLGRQLSFRHGQHRMFRSVLHRGCRRARVRACAGPRPLDHTELGGEEATGVDYLRTLAIARLVLDNFDNLQASWVTQGGKVGQLSLAYGANDMGSVMIEENVVRAAGAAYCMDEIEIVREHRERRVRRQAPQHALRDPRGPDLS